MSHKERENKNEEKDLFEWIVNINFLELKKWWVSNRKGSETEKKEIGQIPTYMQHSVI